MVAYLLEEGADIDKVDGVGWTPLMEAVMDDMPELCAFWWRKVLMSASLTKEEQQQQCLFRNLDASQW